MAANAETTVTSDSSKPDDGEGPKNPVATTPKVKLEQDDGPPKKKLRPYKWTQKMPELKIEEGGIGPIENPNKNDVLNGRGGRTNAWSGNVQFRELINDKKAIYHSPETKKLAKAHICAEVVQQVRNMDPPGRFLKEEEKTGLWWDIGDANAIKKVGQALREHKQEMRAKQLGSDGEPGYPIGSSPKARAHSGVDAFVYDAVGKALRAHEARKDGASKPTPFSASAALAPALAGHAPVEGSFRGARQKLVFGTVVERTGAEDENRFEFRYDDGTVEIIDEIQAKKARGLLESYEQKSGYTGKKVAKLVDGRPLCGTVGPFGEKPSGETFWIVEYDDGSVERCNRTSLEKRIKFETELKKFCNQFE